MTPQRRRSPEGTGLVAGHHGHPSSSAARPALQPVCVTQVTSEAVLGIPGRRYREWVLASHIPHRRLGQLVVVPLDVALAALRPLQAESEPVDELDALRARAGLRRVG